MSLTAFDFELCKPYVENIECNCSYCNKKLTFDNVFVSVSQGIFEVSEGKFVCKGCSSKLPICDRCGKVVQNNDCLTKIEDVNKNYCFDCSSSFAFRCFNCNKYYRDRHAYIQMHGPICRDCYLTVDHFVCESCDNEYLSDRYGIDDMCITCANERVSNCLNYTYKPTPIFYHTDNENNSNETLFLGVELECGGASCAEDVIYFIHRNVSSFFYMKRDASIPAYGCEIVTHPSTFEYHKNVAKWSKLLKSAKEHGMQSDNNFCGIHIHMSRRFFSAEEISLLDFFVNNFSDFWKRIARRESHYSAYVNKNSDEWGMQTSDRHCALNLSNCNTIELRIFKGTLDLDILMSYIEITYHLANFIKRASTIYPNDMQNKFLEYCKYNSSKTLNEYLNKVL